MKILLATNNEVKAKNLKTAFKEFLPEASVLSLKEANMDVDVETQKGTLLANAKQKALIAHNNLQHKSDFDYTLGEDFGFYVQASVRSAGVYTERWSKGVKKDKSQSILELFKIKNSAGKRAEFNCAMVAVNKNHKFYYSSGELKGKIGSKTPKSESFSYDQVVEMPDGRYLSEYSQDERYNISSRRKALKGLVSQFNKNIK
jgi:non-canonical purine NTP pyrophosphatase (RdgB/HAM1 family)